MKYDPCMFLVSWDSHLYRTHSSPNWKWHSSKRCNQAECQIRRAPYCVGHHGCRGMRVAIVTLSLLHSWHTLANCVDDHLKKLILAQQSWQDVGALAFAGRRWASAYHRYINRALDIVIPWYSLKNHGTWIWKSFSTMVNIKVLSETIGSPQYLCTSLMYQ